MVILDLVERYFEKEPIMLDKIKAKLAEEMAKLEAAIDQADNDIIKLQAAVLKALHGLL